MKKERFSVGGMACAVCQSHVQKAVARLDGVHAVTVALLTREMTVEYDPARVTPEQIIAAVENIGFTAGQEQSGEPAEDPLRMEAGALGRRVLASVIFLLPLTYAAMAPVTGLPFPAITPFYSALLQFLLLVPIVFLNRSFFIHGFLRLFKLIPDMETLIALGAGSGIAYSICSLICRAAAPGAGTPLYFEAAGMILTLITFGRFLELRARGKTSGAIARLVKLTPKAAQLEKDGVEYRLPVNRIEPGDMILLRPGDIAPVDGFAVSGSASLDQSAITGESIPVEKTDGAAIISGSMCVNGFLKYRAEKVGAETTLSRITALVREAAAGKAPIARLADKVCAVFVPAVITIALITFTMRLLLGQTAGEAISAAIAVLVISCPCALGLATPVAVMAGTGRAAALGILFRNAEALENLHKITVAVFDKTGTLTTGRPAVTAVRTVPGTTENDLLAQAAALEKFSRHPFAEAICACAGARCVTPPDAQDFELLPGHGIKAEPGGKTIYAGNEKLMTQQHIPVPPELLEQARKLAESGVTPLFFASDRAVTGMIALADEIRSDAADTIRELKALGIRTCMLSGDNPRTAGNIARQLGMDSFAADLMPGNKAEKLAGLRAQGEFTAMIGDGINDAPALAAADVGIAPSSGTEIALDTADVALAGNRLSAVPEAVRLSRAVIANIRMNLFWALFYNSLGIPFAAFGKLDPVFSACAMSLSSLCVVLNALRLTGFKAR